MSQFKIEDKSMDGGKEFSFHTKDVETIASTHLGRMAGGERAEQYKTPDYIDHNLLVAVPRCLNREQYGLIDGYLPFTGYDVWNAYEFSALTDNGFPVTAQLKIVYDADSPSIVESKSLKLYLNSFNMIPLGETIHEVVNNAHRIIAHDLRDVIGKLVLVQLYTVDQIITLPPIKDHWEQLDSTVDVTKLEFEYKENPALLVADKIPGTTFAFNAHTSVLRSNCRVTHQPDWGDVYMHILGKQIPTASSLLQYIISLRNENHFHEEICECIYKRLWDVFAPEELLVACLYTRRGGIDINPVRASNNGCIHRIVPYLVSPVHLVQKTWRQ